MPRSRSCLRQIKEILRLKWELGLSDRRIARGCGLSRPTVANYVRRARACGLSCGLSASLDDAQLERMLFPPLPPRPAASGPRPEPPRLYEYADWKKVRVHIDYHVELERHYYSAPYQLVKQQLDARWTANTVELMGWSAPFHSHGHCQTN